MTNSFTVLMNFNLSLVSTVWACSHSFTVFFSIRCSTVGISSCCARCHSVVSQFIRRFSIIKC